VDTSRFRPRGWTVVFVAALAAVVALVAAGTVSGKSKKASAAPLVAFLLPENVTPRWEGSDAPIFKATLSKLVPGVKIDIVNALNSSATQQSQAETELTKGAKVLVVAAVDQVAAAVIVNAAHQKGVPVIAYDRLIKNCPLAYYDTFNSVAVGQAEAQWMAGHTKKGAKLVIIDGSPTDDNAHLVNTGIHKVLNPLFKKKTKVMLAQTFTPGWDPSTAQTEAEQYLTRFSNKIDGFVVANDGMSGGVIAALKGVNLQGKIKTTGQDASLEGIQNVVLGYQGVTVFKDFRIQARVAARITEDILKHRKVRDVNAKTFNGKVKVPTVFLKVVPIDLSNIKTLVTNGWIKSQYGGLKNVCKGLPKKSICK
jgi:D-xylose transport system substrate-binding protein